MAADSATESCVRQQLIVASPICSLQPMVVSKEKVREEFSRRLVEALGDLGHATFAAQKHWLHTQCGVSKEAARKWLQGLGLPRQEKWIDLAKSLKVNVTWLRDFEGEKRVGLPVRQKPEAPPESNLSSGKPRRDGWPGVDGYAQAVGLSGGVEAELYQETHKLKFRADSLARKRLIPENLAVVYGKGDSMYPAIQSGDAILFDKSDVRPRHGKMFLVRLNGVAGDEYSVKRCEIVGKLVLFRADNPGGDHNWTAPRWKDEPRHEIEIIGRVRWIAGWED